MTTTAGELKYWVGFNIVKGVGPTRLRMLLDHFGSLAKAWEADEHSLKQAGLPRNVAQKVRETRHKISLDAEMKKIEQAGAHILTWENPDYPRHLLNIHSPPPVLYVRGRLRPEDEWAVAVVGTRRASVYGREATRRLARDLASQGITIVSGMALGIDTEAHRAALQAGGRTIAVLGCGVDVTYPRSNRKLAEEICAHGAILSEYSLGTRPEAGNFPPRNRIISGLSLGVLVTEASERSGALITASYAGEQGRDVFAVPGNIFNRGSKGTNDLIRDNAVPVTSVRDIIEALNLTMVSEYQEARVTLPENATEAAVYARLSANPTHVDEIQRSCDMPMAQVSSTLALMELKGMIRRVEGMYYVAVREEAAEYVASSQE